MMKYVCFHNAQTNQEEIMVFPKNINHDCFAEVQRHIRNSTVGNWTRIYREPISAGFVTFLKDGITCFGNSETLNLVSREKDTELLRNQLEGH